MPQMKSTKMRTYISYQKNLSQQKTFFMELFGLLENQVFITTKIMEENKQNGTSKCVGDIKFLEQYVSPLAEATPENL